MRAGGEARALPVGAGSTRARARSACLRRAAPACGSPHLGLGLRLHADLLDLQADEARDVLARARVEEHAARIGDAVILAAPRDDALVGRLNARETVAHGGRWCGEHEGWGGEEGEGGRRSRAQWQPRPQLHPPARRTSPPPRLRSPARAPAAPRSPLPHQDQFAGSALLLGRHAPAAAEGWSFRGLRTCTAQPRRLLFAGPQTANNFLRLIESVHLIDAPHRTPHALAARTPPAGGCPHAVLAEGMRATWCCRRQLAAPGGSRRGGWDVPPRGCALARRARRPCASGNRPIRSDLPKTSA